MKLAYVPPRDQQDSQDADTCPRGSGAAEPDAAVRDAVHVEIDREVGQVEGQRRVSVGEITGRPVLYTPPDADQEPTSFPHSGEAPLLKLSEKVT